MRSSSLFRRHVSRLIVGALSLSALPAAFAALTSLADAPLANSPSTSVLPNLMYILDDSGSMAWTYMPDYVHFDSQGNTYAHCRVCTASSCTGPGGTGSAGSPCGNSSSNANTEVGNVTPTYGEAPFYANAFNKIWYNPDITYAAAVNASGTSMGNASPTGAKMDAYLDNTLLNLTNQFPEVVYCNVSSPTSSNLTDTTKCRYQGKHNVSPFSGTTTYFLLGQSTGANAGFPTTAFWSKKLVQTSNAHYYNIASNELCNDVNLTNCQLATAAGGSPAAGYTIEAPVRWCKTAADAIATTVVSGNSGGVPRCQKKFDLSNSYIYPRFGRFTRVDIVSSTATYTKGPNAKRTDCAAAASCTYAEEIQNFANWWSYYRTRLSLMKTSTGRAFLSIDDRFKVGFITINPNNPVTTDKFVPVKKFDSTQRTSFYTTLYTQDTNGSTPLREALSRVGRYYAGITTGINSGMISGTTKPDPVEYSCQTNYALLTTDGYWNGNAGQTLTGSGIGNQDNADSGYTTRAVGAFDGNLSGASDSLADVAAYYYKTDLRTSGTVSANNVPTNEPKDLNTQQHMVTFSLGLGLEGFMDYKSDYETSTTGDFAKIKTAASSCSWAAGTCNWPIPSANAPSALDDLWHAAVNGRGSYFSASDPNSLASGLQTALGQLRVATAAASAAATSTPNITQTDNFIYSSTFRTGKWDGEITAKRVDPATGNILPTVIWTAQGQLDLKAVSGRTIYTIDETGGGKRKPFLFANLSTTTVGGIAPEQPYFSNKCASWSQCTLLTTAQKVTANDGNNLVNYLRGDRSFESFVAPDTESPFRQRDHVLGDPVSATPAFVKTPPYNFSDAVTPTYASYKLAQTSRQGMLYVAANDGMLHAFNGDTGDEVWAYVPRIVMPRISRLATDNWGGAHVFTVDGTPQIMDVFIGSAWKTILVAGLNSGGRGYYALDVTNPAVPTVLWEVCADATICANADTDMGYSYGNPLISKRKSDGRWVVFVTSGMNNVSPGTGRGFLYVIDAATGAILSKVGTGVGDTTTPSGLNDIAGFADNFDLDNTARLIYGGDLNGNVWRFDTASGTPGVSKLAQLFDSGGKPQSITTRPELALIQGFPVVYVGTGRYLGVDDLVDPATLSLPYAYQQSLYAIKDKGTGGTYTNMRAANVVVNTLIDNGTTRTTSNNTVDWTVKDGWYIDLNPGNTSPGERINLDPQLVQGTLVVASNIPNNSACTIGGDSFIYQFDYQSGRFVSSAAGQVAGTKTTGEIKVGIDIFRLPSGVFKGVGTGASGNQTTFPINIGGGGGTARRISWRELMRK
jgi:type IV pilus assembly protein PilY1